MTAFQSCGINPEEYLKARNMDESLPWEHIDSGITKEFLMSEVEKAYKTKLTPDCRTGKCASCGIQDAIGTRCWALNLLTNQKPYAQAHNSNEVREVFSVMRIRFQFAKGEELKFISHLDVINAFTRAFRRAGIPIAYSHGFSPNPKLMFGSVLPVGTISESEFADIELESYMSPQDFFILSNNHLPSGLEILKAEEVSLKVKPLMAQINLASYKVIVNDVKENPKNQIDSLMNKDHIWVNQPAKDNNIRKKGLKTSKTYDIRPSIRNISLLKYNDRIMELEMVLGDNHAGKVRPEQIVRLILDDFKLSEIEIRKTGSFVESQGSLFSPFDMENELSGHSWA